MTELIPTEKYKKDFPGESGYRYFDMTLTEEERKERAKVGLVRVRVVNESGVTVTQTLMSRGWFEGGSDGE